MNTALLQIWMTEGRNVITKAIYTDNPKIDERFLKEAFNSVKLHENHLLNVLLV